MRTAIMKYAAVQMHCVHYSAAIKQQTIIFTMVCKVFKKYAMNEIKDNKL